LAKAMPMDIFHPFPGRGIFAALQRNPRRLMGL
jgi:hypothetical protein